MYQFLSQSENKTLESHSQFNTQLNKQSSLNNPQQPLITETKQPQPAVSISQQKPTIRLIKTVKIKKSKAPKSKARKRFSWTYKQNKIYCLFIEQFKQTLLFQQKKDKFQIFKKMSMAIGTRTPVNCKSHHQKMLQRYGSIQKVIQEIKKSAQKISQSNNDETEHTRKLEDIQKNRFEQKETMNIKSIELELIPEKIVEQKGQNYIKFKEMRRTHCQDSDDILNERIEEQQKVIKTNKQQGEYKQLWVKLKKVKNIIIR